MPACRATATASPSATRSATGTATLTFELRVTDAAGLSAVDTLAVVVRSPDIDADGVPNSLDAFPSDPTEWLDSDGDPEVLLEGFGMEDAHSVANSLVFGPDGWLYVPVGAPCNVCERPDTRYASITRIKPDGSGLEVFASGVRNTVADQRLVSAWEMENDAFAALGDVEMAARARAMGLPR